MLGGEEPAGLLSRGAAPVRLPIKPGFHSTEGIDESQIERSQFPSLRVAGLSLSNLFMSIRSSGHCVSWDVN